MATAIWCELVCAQCSRIEHGCYTYDGRVPRTKLKDQAKRSGWLFEADEAFCSKECLDLYNNPLEI